MSSVLAYSTSSPVPLGPVTAAAAMRQVAAAARAAARVAEGLVAHDRLYGTWICRCLCRRCRPTKDDCGGCVAGGCEREFVSHESAARFYGSYGLGYDRRVGGPTWS